jgi:hypothetical protein
MIIVVYYRGIMKTPNRRKKLCLIWQEWLVCMETNTRLQIKYCHIVSSFSSSFLYEYQFNFPSAYSFPYILVCCLSDFIFHVPFDFVEYISSNSISWRLWSEIIRACRTVLIALPVFCAVILLIRSISNYRKVHV